MNNTTITIDKDVMDRHPEVMVGAFVVTGLDTMTARLIESLPSLQQSTVHTLNDHGVTIQNLAESVCVAPWRKAVQMAGLKPSTFKSSVEQLRRRLLKGEFATPIPAVTAYCMISASMGAPLGAYDLDRLPANQIALRLPRNGDHFSPIGGRSADFPLSGNVTPPVYAAGSEICCWMFNVRDSAVTCLTPGTRRAIFIGEAVTLLQQDNLRDALANLANLFPDGVRSGDHIRYASINTPTMTFNPTAAENS